MQTKRKPKFVDVNQVDYLKQHVKALDGQLVVSSYAPNEKKKTQLVKNVSYSVATLVGISTAFVLCAYLMFDGYHIWTSSNLRATAIVDTANHVLTSFNCEVVDGSISDNLKQEGLNDHQVSKLLKRYEKQTWDEETKKKCHKAREVVLEGHGSFFRKEFASGLVFGPCYKLASLMQETIIYLFPAVSAIVGFFASLLGIARACGVPVTGLHSLFYMTDNRGQFNV